MDINRLREFLVLSEHLNYSKAANLLYITQPVLSRHIHDLEENLGGQLFLRDTHKVQLTPFGELCAEQLKNVLETYDSALLNIRRASDTSCDTLTVGFLEYAVRPFLTDFAASFQTAHPNIEIDYTSGDLDTLAEAVLEDQMDLAFVTHVGPDSLQTKHLEAELIYEDQVLAVLPPSHPLEDRETISLEELSAYPMVTFSQATNQYTSNYHVALFEDRGLHPTYVKEISTFESGLFYAKAGQGAFLIPQHLSFLAGDLHTILISDEDCVLPLNLIWKKQNPKESLQTFVKSFKGFYRNR